MYVIVNPAAGKGKAARVFGQVRHLLKQAEVVFTAGRGDAIRLAAEAARSGRETVVAVGGDGTVSEVVNGLAEAGFRSALGIIPAGAGNDFRWALGIPKDPRQAVRILHTGSPRPVDAGLVESKGFRRYFANLLGIGFNARIAQLTQSQKRSASPLRYLGSVLPQMLGAKPLPLELRCEDFAFAGPLMLLQAANGGREGGIFRVGPEYRLDDGLLDLQTIGYVPPLRRPWLLLQGLRGHLRGYTQISHRQFRSLTVSSPQAIPCHMDGEYFDFPPGTELRIMVQGGVLTVIGPCG